jgi:hypothetical protein
MSIVARIKKKIWNLGAILFFVWFGFKAIGYGMDLLNVEVPSICKNTDVAEFPSPDGKKIATLGYSDCGATTNWQSGINIVDVNTGKVYRGLFGLDGKPDNLEVVWTSNTKVVVSNFSIEKLLWFNNDNFAGAWISLEPSMANKSLKQDK